MLSVFPAGIRGQTANGIGAIVLPYYSDTYTGYSDNVNILSSRFAPIVWKVITDTSNVVVVMNMIVSN